MASSMWPRLALGWGSISEHILPSPHLGATWKCQRPPKTEMKPCMGTAKSQLAELWTLREWALTHASSQATGYGWLIPMEHSPFFLKGPHSSSLKFKTLPSLVRTSDILPGNTVVPSLVAFPDFYQGSYLIALSSCVCWLFPGGRKRWHGFLSSLYVQASRTWVVQLGKCWPSAQVMFSGPWDRAPWQGLSLSLSLSSKERNI